MNNTMYKQRRVTSPYQVTRPQQTPSEHTHPLEEEISKCLGTYELTAEFEVDEQTKGVLSHVPGLVTFLCTLKKDNEVIGQGRGSAVMSRMNRYVQRTVQSAFNSSLIDAVVRGVRVLEAQNSGLIDLPNDGVASYPPTYGFEGITEKQKSYLETLIGNVSNEEEREGWMSRLSVMTKDEASAAIAMLKEY